MPILRPMAYETSKANADCAVTALANYYGKTYDDVLADLNANKTYKWESHTTKGYVSATYTKVMCKYEGRTYFVCKHPRRGQEKLTGLARVARMNAKTGHLIAIIDGCVFDSWHRGTPIKEYMAMNKYHLKGIYK